MSDLPEMEFDYKNYAGKKGSRRVKPLFIWYGTTEWHKEPGWLLRAFDFSRDAERDFAMKDMSNIR